MLLFSTVLKINSNMEKMISFNLQLNGIRAARIRKTLFRVSYGTESVIFATAATIYGLILKNTEIRT